MERFESGHNAGSGSFRCTVCSFTVSLRESDSLPECPGCGGRRFERAPMFADADTAEVPAPDVGVERPDWLDDARAEIGAPGDYLAFADGDRIETLELPDGWTRIGRSLSAELRIDDPTVSRRHALVHRDRGTVRLLDDRSLNGVFRNGHRVDLDELQDGDTIAIGRFQLHFLRLARDRQPALTNA